ncbi:ubiquitin-conjugating enzyme E2 [Candidatus Electronema sp. TJ]|uniref:ubiquitin-conjugating enzyme E2 n=1 Tax=Candidatus Electronema sp. TJ TaxID=3401573 RepID=UPI003AA910AC
MASQTDQRTADLEEVRKILEHHPRVKLLNTEGEPPDCYEIEYRLAGLSKAEDGSISRASSHVMLITLPFGYPHFPPAVKPLTPVFHPDIDPDGVRISSRWQQEPSLAKLILHIGEMICGKTYSLQDPFNQEAADWYSEHAAELPLDSLEGGTADAGVTDEFDFGLEDIDLSSIAPSAEEEVGGIELSLEMEAPQAVHDISGVDHSENTEQDSADFALELDASPSAAAQEDFDIGVNERVQDEAEFELEIGEPEAAPPQADFAPKLAEIRAHIDRKEIYIAERLLKEIPPALPEAEGFRQKVKAAQEQCDTLLQEMKMLEEEDNFPEAKKILVKLKKVAADLPGLADIGRRLEQSQSLLDTFSSKKESVAAEPQAEQLPSDGEKKKKRPSPPPPPPKEKAAESAEKNKGKSRVSRTIRREIPVAPFAAAGIAAALIVAGGLMYTRDSNILLEAGLDWQEAQSLLKRKNYQGAEEKAGAALGRLKSILIPLPEKSRIRKEIEAMLASGELIDGKEGKRSYKGKNMPLAEADKHEKTDLLAAQAAEKLKANSTSEAAAFYEQAAALAAQAPVYPVAAETERFQEEARQLRLKEAQRAAEEAEDLGDWKKAAESWQQAVKHCKGGEDCEKFKKRMSDAIFKRELDVSRESFKDSHTQWQETVRKLKDLQERMDSDPKSFTDEHRRELEQLLIRSQFYQLLSAASEFYSKGDDAAAVRDYKTAAELLRSRQAMFEPEERSGADKITRTAVMIEVSAKLNAAGEAERQGGRQSEALRLYEEVQKLLGTSGLDPVLERSVKEKLEGLRQDVDGKRRMDWLNRNYKKLFCEAYSYSCGSDLSKPGMTLSKKINGMELYKLHCVERSQGSSYRLELEYLYNPTANQWTPYRNAGQ